VRKTFSDFLRVTFKWFLDPIGGFLNRLGLSPNTVTIIGLLGSCLAAYFVAVGQITWWSGHVDAWPIGALDGTMARLRGRRLTEGLVDSVSDR
jgi:CDP-diacylglycerol--glycerol-3-phosphate 3-phosphatidyltransferase